MRRTLPWFLATLVLVLDRITKMAVLRTLPEGGFVPVFPGLAVVHVHNRGIAFSLFADGGPLGQRLLQIVILAAVVFIAVIAYRHAHGSAFAAVGLGLILGGAVGNLVDRLLYGWVVDFIHVWVQLGERVYSWPDFNVADSAITVGAVFLVANELRRRPAGAEENDASDPD